MAEKLNTTVIQTTKRAGNERPITMNSRTYNALTCAVVLATGVMTLAVATPTASAAEAYPMIPVAISGTFDYTTNNTTMQRVSFSNKSYIALLNASTAAVASIQLVTGKDKIPAGSQIAFNPDNGGSLAITNVNGFNFPLNGSQGGGYSYGYLEPNHSYFHGAYNKVSGKETDVTGFVLSLFDGNNFQISLYSEGSMSWTYGLVHNDFLKATLRIKASGSGYQSVGGVDGGGDGIITSFSLSGSGSASEPTSSIPYYNNY
jgi:hypothetical protein